MKALKEYLCEGIFDTAEDAVPIYDLVTNWFQENVPYEKLGKTYDIEIKNNTTIIIPKHKGKYAKQFFFKEPLPDYIKFDDNNWSNDNICACIEYKKSLFDITYINDQKEIDKFPRIYSIFTELSNLYINASNYCYIYGNNQLVKNFKIYIDYGKYHDGLVNIENVKLDDFNDIVVVNKYPALDFRLNLKSLQGKCKKFCDDIKTYSKTCVNDKLDYDFITDHKETFDWLDKCNINFFLITVKDKIQLMVSRTMKDVWKILH